jgi:hypothetical protein
VSELEPQRQAKHRLAAIRHAQEVTGNVAQTCRYLQNQPADLRTFLAIGAIIPGPPPPAVYPMPYLTALHRLVC